MKYSQYRENIKDGDIIAFSHYEWGSLYDLQIQAVRLFTQSEYSHVGIVVEFGGRLFLAESVVPVVRLVPLSNLLGKKGIYHIAMHTRISNEELEFAMSKVGSGRYSKWQAIMSQLKKLRVGDDDLWECAEYVIECRKRSGVDLGPVATPAEVVQAALDQGKTMHFVQPN
jgi:hypothetical protein